MDTIIEFKRYWQIEHMRSSSVSVNYSDVNMSVTFTNVTNFTDYTIPKTGLKYV